MNVLNYSVTANDDINVRDEIPWGTELMKDEVKVTVENRYAGKQQFLKYIQRKRRANRDG